MKNYQITLIGMLTGVLLALSFPPMPFYLLAFVAFVPLLFAYELKPKRPNLMTWLAFFIYHTGSNWWISSWQKDCDPYLLGTGLGLDIFHPFMLMIPLVFYQMLRKKIGLSKALWYFPFIFVCFEWLHSLSDIAFPWLTIGYTQIYNTAWVQFADIGGVWVISFSILLINVIALKMILIVRDSGVPGKSFLLLFQNRRFSIYAATIILFIIVPMIYGFSRLSEFDHHKLLSQNNNLKVGIVQPDINPWSKWDSSPIDQIVEHKRIQDSLIARTGPLDFVAWSETAMLFLGTDVNAGHNFSFITSWLKSSNTSLLTGFADMYFYKPGEKTTPTTRPFQKNASLLYDSYNSALLLNPNSNPDYQIYHKMRLTPFGERTPFLDQFPFLGKLVEWSVGISNWDIGRQQKVMILDKNGVKSAIGPIICIESIYPGFVANLVKLKAEVFTVITNDGWYDFTVGPEQHYQIAAMRAIESRRYIVRCANTGVSGFIAPTGKSILRAPQYNATAIATLVPKLSYESIYVMTGDWLPEISTIIVGFCIILYIFIKKKNTSDL